ncbi:GNAT family N-acetyltransferase [Sphingomonas sp. RG327]|uniref:GNAT family N-acetyltransferase n=1 Tax=Sphingomonas anseongensis TaxID=2908207 RepID=A0ABT0RER2_9SPHN|nr:GNAT family N-acetyltransferase [Sphingomonas anseongensis]MCL6678775.1 GNAT family N-acetyltransferase [Sphingomonas anseongensis]
MAEVIAETDRLLLRTWDEQDLDEFIARTNTPAVMRWLGGVAPREQHEAAFERLKAYQRDFGHTFWIVERKSDAALLGFCGLKRVNHPNAGPITGDFEVGWRLREDAWGQGYAKEAAIESLDLAFERFGAPHVVALTVPGNAASQALMKRLGMKLREELDFVDSRFEHPGDLNPAIVYAIQAAEWPEARARALRPR